MKRASAPWSSVSVKHEIWSKNEEAAVNGVDMDGMRRSGGAGACRTAGRQGLQGAGKSATGQCAGGKNRNSRIFHVGCPHCEHFEPVLTGWVKKQSPDIVLKHVPLAFNKALAAHQKLYHALDALGLADQLTPSIFKAIHTERNYLLTPEAQAAFLAKKGVDK